ncbi:MAG: DUF3291 domain-containing protein [Saprospiraceae bacterium]
MDNTKTKASQITTLTLVKYPSLKTKIWAFGMMQYAHQYLSNVSGLSFYKLMGSGKGLGFNPFPDWSTYALLQVWNTETDAIQFMENSPLVSLYDKNSSERISLFMKNITAHGKWSKQEPFKVSDSLSEVKNPIAVITRATIKTKELRRFWKFVPTAQKPIENAKGLIYTKGIGEVPIKQMATFSIWNNLDAVKQYAYKSREHAQAVKMTRQHNWYSEELFARFELYKKIGTWKDIEL